MEAEIARVQEALVALAAQQKQIEHELTVARHTSAASPAYIQERVDHHANLLAKSVAYRRTLVVLQGNDPPPSSG